MEEGLGSIDGRVERLLHTVTQPWQNERNLNARTLPKNLGTMQQLFERSQQIQQMFTHVSTMVRDFTEGVNQLRATKSTENCQVMSNLAAKGSSPIVGLEMAPGRAGSFSI
ncbi:hypothetical protein E2C01_101961 [Portunus trituberculatus]|uniref:Uncharacterized protein n=1 Tax=Portunus trituberculatus TaxID=210409 RepID=A0A5B7KLM2_PORTR|nr:hypothetical protein [Portunus trituberculatus]